MRNEIIKTIVDKKLVAKLMIDDYGNYSKFKKLFSKFL